ncbi:MAG: DUF5689 domain-containing protein [Balneolaceae bacterium]
MTNFYNNAKFDSFIKLFGWCFLLVAMVFATSINIQAQTILEEELRDGATPDGWEATDVEFTTSASGYANFTGVTGVLTSPSIDLSGVTGATLSYSVAKFGSGDDGPLTIEISTDGGTTWTAQTEDTGTPTSSTYLNEELELDAAAIGENDVKIRFTAENSPTNKRLRDVLLVGPDGITLEEAIEVSTIADLRDGDTDGTRYKLTGEAVLAFYDSFNNRRYLVDGTAGIFSEDPGNLPEELTEIGQGVTGMEGTLSIENNGAIIRFNPDAGSANATITSEENELTPEEIALADLSLDDTGKLVTISGATFQETGTFSTGENYTIEDGDGNTLTFRTDYFNADYIGEAIPSGELSITGVVGGFGTDPQIFARSSDDMVEVATAAEPVTVTFRVNTATIPDALNESGFVQIRGDLISTLDNAAYGAQNVTWDDSSTPVAENDGGDYWSTEVTMAPGDSLVYKYWVGLDSETGAAPNGGWEADGPFNGNYLYVLPDTSDNVTLDLAYYNIGEGRDAPFVSKTDTVAVWFRVNVGYQVQTGDFDPEEDSVSVRGTPAPLGWDDTTIQLEKEENSAGDNLFYSGVAYFDKDTLAASEPDGRPANTIKYKFFLDNDTGDGGYETTSDRFVTFETIGDTTFQYVNFSDTPPAGDVISTNLNFEVNVGILEGLGYFNSSIDTVAVTGSFNNWNNTANKMSFNSFSGTYEASSIPLTSGVGDEVLYKYYIKWDASRDDENSDNYFPLISANDSGWEEPGITGGGNRVLTIEDAADQETQSDFFNGVSPKALMTESNVEGGAISVTYSIDMSPATSRDTRPFNPESDSVFLSVEVPFFALTNDLPTYVDDIATWSIEQRDKVMFTDDDKDMVYELTFDLTLPTLNHFGFNIVYGEPTSADGEIIQAGPGGTDAGRRFYQYVTPQIDDELNVSWPSSFTFPTLTWTQDALPYELSPDYTEETVSNEGIGEGPDVFSLSQNYPNPFNPTTNINFNLANSAEVNLIVFNVLGQKVATLVNNRKMSTGLHSVAFDASRLSSGVYFYRLEAGDFVQQRSMTLIK